MASSGSFRTAPSYNGRCLVFSWVAVSQSEEYNTTAINWSVSAAGGDDTWYSVNNLVVYLDGMLVYSIPSDSHVQYAPGEMVASGSYTMSHNGEGKRTFTASVEAGIYEWQINTRGSSTFTLDDISQASQPSLVTWPVTTNDVGYFGEQFPIFMNRKSYEFTHTVRYEYGDRSGVIGQNVENDIYWTIPFEFINDIPGNTSASGRIFVDTYKGSTFIGTRYTGFTVKVPTSIKPSCSIQVLDATDTKDYYGSLVKGLSKLYVKTTAYPAYSSPITLYNVIANGSVYGSAEITTSVLRNAGTTTVTADVTDRRGRRSESVSTSFPVLDYESPNVSRLTVVRCNEDGTANRRGDHVKVVFSAAVTDIDGKNNARYNVYYKKNSESLFTKIPLTDITNQYSVTDKEYIFAASKGNTYDVKVEAEDRHKSGIRSAKAPTAYAILSWRGFRTSNGVEDGVGIGMVPEKPNTLQVAWDTEFYGGVSGTIFDAIYPVNSIYISYSHVYPGELFGGDWERMQDGFLWASRETDNIGVTGGEKTHLLTLDEMPIHDHGSVYSQHASGLKSQAWYSESGDKLAYGIVQAGGGLAHNNMPPYIQVSIWRRTG